MRSDLDKTRSPPSWCRPRASWRALETLGYHNEGGENRWGPRLPNSRTLAPPDVTTPENLFAPTSEGSGQPLLFDQEPSVFAYN
jgi:hypothetical protein